MTMKINILTLFPDMFKGPFSESMVKRAQEEKVVEIELHNLRRWTTDKHRSVDAPPFGGGPGMVMRVDVIDQAIKNLRKKNSKVVLLDTKIRISYDSMGFLPRICLHIATIPTDMFFGTRALLVRVRKVISSRNTYQ